MYNSLPWLNTSKHGTLHYESQCRIVEPNCSISTVLWCIMRVSVTMAMPLFSGKNEDEQEQSTTKGGNLTVYNKLPRTHWGGYSQAGDFLTPRTNYWCITFQGISVLKLRVNMHMSMVWMCIGCGKITSYVELNKPTPETFKCWLIDTVTESFVLGSQFTGHDIARFMDVYAR